MFIEAIIKKTTRIGVDNFWLKAMHKYSIIVVMFLCT